jgi:hypothetical protein
MPRKRPTAVLVIAIFHFILGGCCGAAGIFQLAGGQQMLAKLQAGANKQQTDIQDRLQRGIEQRFPAFKTLERAEAASAVVLAVILLIAGIGLLAMQPWARWLSIAYGVLGILRTVADLLLAIVFVLPAVQAASREIPGVPPEAVQIGGLVGMLGSGCANLVYPVVVLIVMLLPGVAAAFRAPAVSYDRPERDDWDEDGYERGRGRWPEQPPG